TSVHLRWGRQPGVVRYRLQVAQDREFRDIVFDRIVNGNETTVNDLTPGVYFWRIAPLTTSLGAFSGAAPIEVRASGIVSATRPTQAAKTGIVDAIRPTQVANGGINVTGGWRAGVGAVSNPVLAHLRSRESFDVIGTNSQGVTFALEALTGVSLWSVAL